MKLIIISAVSIDGVIGIDDKMPWRIPEDFKHYRNTTMGHTLLVGSNTYKSLPPIALEGRSFIVLSTKNQVDLVADNDNATMFTNIEDAMKFANDLDKVFVIGGESIYNALIDECDEVIITWVNKMYSEGNKKFPIDNLFANFEIINDQSWIKSKLGLSYKITNYIRS